MTDTKLNQKIENYLTMLERALQPFPASDRAEIVLELKSHILAALERDQKTNIDVILTSLGAPETVANRYLLERGLKPLKPPISPIFKWLAIGGLGSIALLLLFLGGMTVWFTRHMHWNPFTERRLNFSFSTRQISGSHEFESEKPKIQVKFKNGKFDLATSEDGAFSWDCKGITQENSRLVQQPTSPNEWVLDLSGGPGVKCELTIPEGASFTIEGNNGKISIKKPKFALALHLANGKVEVRPDSEIHYRYTISVQNGQTDSFESSSDLKALPIEIKLTNGKISKVD